MSRCFPFPPPGYEKKGRTDDLDLFKKEKQREKKHKKEKRDKEKRESKEKREKEGKDGKHKEKKDKKEKHREKKKDRDKEKEKDKNKNNTADEKGFPGQTEGLNAGKVIKKEIKQNDRKGILLEGRLPKHFADNNGEKAREKNNHLAKENKDSKFLQELGRRIKEEDGGAGNQLGQELRRKIKEEDGRADNQFVQRFTFDSQKKDEPTPKLLPKDSSTWLDGKEKIKDKSIDVKKIDGQGIRAEARPIENATVHNHAGNFHSRVGGMPRSLEKNLNRAVEATLGTRETSKEKKDDKPGDKRKDRDKGKKGHGKDKDRDKEKKKEKVKEQTEHKNTVQNMFKVSNKGGPMSTNSFPQVSKNSQENSVGGENLKKRKDIESNGILHASDNWPSKLPRQSSSPHPFTENGRIVKPCQSSIPHASDSPVAATNFKVDNKEQKKNGIIGARPSADSLNKPISATVPADPVNEETSAKPPHPDSKYLSQVYSVPKMDEQPDFDDQEWLFGSQGLPKKRPTGESSKLVGTEQVWAEALHIEPDVYALPYVIPY
ncbi:myb-like protein X [Neltuma alba]|uniref:myb-like protein X n=1 Tax=Neltuma alba TaxID=207710 RepID=UPI0010A3FBF1|nr:myb-like protein X [Prosopis alba]XP_028759714.1 myb-like protein X [Prosopis alba]